VFEEDIQSRLEKGEILPGPEKTTFGLLRRPRLKKKRTKELLRGVEVLQQLAPLHTDKYSSSKPHSAAALASFHGRRTLDEGSI
jgi:hypothetical protein